MSDKIKKAPESLVKYEHLLAGVSGGIVSTVTLHPLDLLKVRLAGKFFSSFLLNISPLICNFLPSST